MSKTIAIDIDDVLAINVPAFIAHSNERWGTRLTIDDYEEHWGRMWKVDHQEFRSRSEEFHDSDLMATYAHQEDAVPVLEKLKKEYKLVVTTSRQIKLEQLTQEWIGKYFEGIFTEIHFAGMWDKITKDSHLATKAALCQQIGADYLIDDQPKHCLAAAEVGLQSLLFGDYPWNKDVEEFDGLKRVNNWCDVAEYFGV